MKKSKSRLTKKCHRYTSQGKEIQMESQRSAAKCFEYCKYFVSSKKKKSKNLLVPILTKIICTPFLNLACFFFLFFSSSFSITFLIFVYLVCLLGVGGITEATLHQKNKATFFTLSHKQLCVETTSASNKHLKFSTWSTMKVILRTNKINQIPQMAGCKTPISN